MSTHANRTVKLCLVGLLTASVVACAAPTREIVREAIKETVVVEKEVTAVFEKEVTAVPDQPIRGGSMSFAHAGNLVGIDPFYRNVDHAVIRNTLYNPILNYQVEAGKFTVVPELAESWQESEDHRTLILNLRPNVKFHNGDELTAEHIVFNIERARDPERGGHCFAQFKNVESVKALDKYTVEINYTDIAPGKYDALAFIRIIHPDSEDKLDETGIGTGPFRLEDWAPGDQATFVRFEDYWEMGADGESLPYVDEVVWRYMPDAQTRVLNLEQGALDLVWPVAPSEVARLSVKPELVVSVDPAPGYHCLLVNVAEGPLQEKKVRQALAHALNRDKMVQLALYGLTTPQCALFPWNWPHDPKLEEHPLCEYNLQKAQELLVEAGYPDGFELRMAPQPNAPEVLDFLQIYKEDLAQIGIDATIEIWTGTSSYYDSNFELFASWRNYTNRDPNAAFTGGSNLRPINNPNRIEELSTYDYYVDLLEKAREEEDREERYDMYHELQEYLLEEAFQIIIARNPAIYGQRARVKNFRLVRRGSKELDFRDTWLTE